MYNPKIWYDGDIVTSGGLNNIEQGIAQNAHDIEDLSEASIRKNGYKQVNELNTSFFKIGQNADLHKDQNTTFVRFLK